MKTLLLLLTALVALPCLQSCETQDSGGAITITPAYAEIRAGQSITLTASGGINYTWSLATSGAGGLSRTTGNSVLFIAPSSLTTTTEQVITVTSNTDAPATTSSTSSSNIVTTVSSGSGTATIRILGSGRSSNASSSSSSSSTLPPMP